MRVIKGIFYLLCSIIWVLTVVPPVVIGGYASLYSALFVAYNDLSADPVEWVLGLLIALGIVASAIIITHFGWGLLVSSWKTIKGTNIKQRRPRRLSELKKL